MQNDYFDLDSADAMVCRLYLHRITSTVSTDICNVQLPNRESMRMLVLLQAWMWSSPALESDVMILTTQQKLNG